MIDRYARHKWVFAVDQPARQIQTVTLRAVLYGGQGFGRDCQYGFFGLFKFATIQNMRFARTIGSLGDDAHAHHWGLERAGFEFLQFRLQPGSGFIQSAHVGKDDVLFASISFGGWFFKGFDHGQWREIPGGLAGAGGEAETADCVL